MSQPTLKQRIQEDMKTTMKARDARRLGLIRLLLAAIKQREVDERIELDDVQVLAVIDKMMKQRQDSANQFRNAGRVDLEEQENYEMTILQEYLPIALTDSEITNLIEEAIAETHATAIKDMAAVMAVLKPVMQGRADMGLVSRTVKEKLS